MIWEYPIRLLKRGREFVVRWQRPFTLNEIVISRAALRHNWRCWQKQRPRHYLCPVLKSNAYGHGLLLVARFWQQFRPPFLAVDSTFEALILHRAGIRLPLLILGPYPPLHAIPRNCRWHWVVSDFAVLERLYTLDKDFPLHLFFDTGMHREGFPPTAWPRLRAWLRERKKNIEGVATHFASPELAPQHPAWVRQVQRWRQLLQAIIRDGFQVRYIHAEATGSARQEKPLPGNMVRLGLGLYGYDSVTPTQPRFPLQPALHFRSTIVSIKEAAAGEWVGYGATFRTKRKMRLGIVAAGYAEGVDRRLSNCGYWQCAGKAVPICGRVSMNMTVVDLSNLPQVRVGERVYLYRGIAPAPYSLVRAAELCKTIPYELLVHLAPSIRRTLSD
jgi:alanine racemase